MKLEIKRSPAKVAWWVMFNGSVISVTKTKREAQAEVNELMETDVWQATVEAL